jgi:DNA helicase TIP49 (TBP-interacting protein)
VLQVEGIGIDEESLAYLGEIGERTSLRHSVQVRLAQVPQRLPVALATQQLCSQCTG